MRDSIFFAHIAILLCTAVVILISDARAALWVRGNKPTLDGKSLRRYHRLAWIGLLGMIFTGAFLSYPMLSYLLQTPMFYVKMAFVLALCVNGYVIGRHMYIAAERPYASLSANEKIPLYVSGVVSSIGWVGTVIFALILF